ncbi:hypothetical protein GCM10027040_13190 [Halomonas shantousis]
MSDLTAIEKRQLERLLGMSSGYALDFSNRTFSEFFEEHTHIDIDPPIYTEALQKPIGCAHFGNKKTTIS